MAWVFGLLAAVIGAYLASEGEALFGFLVGFALTAAIVVIARQSQRLDDLASRLQRLDTRVQMVSNPSVPSSEEGEAPPSSAAVAGAPPEIPPEEFEPESAFAQTRAAPEPAAEAPSKAEPAPARAPSLQRPTPPPIEPNGFDRLLDAARTFFFEGNVPVKLGLLVSLFGVAALIRFASNEGWLTVPIPYRIAAIAAAAIALLIYGFRQTPLRPAFGLSLQGGAIGVLLLTVFGSYRIPELLPSGLAFALVLFLVTGAAVLAIRQNAVWLAVIGFLGGYLAPLLLSTGSGNHVALFTYYALLNGAVFGMAWVRPWRALNLMGFAFTFGVGAIWGARYFKPELFWTVEPFLIAFFLMFVTIPVAYALRGRTPGKVDATLLFGTPLIAFPMQVGLLDSERMPLAFSALGVAAIYLGLGLWARREEKLKVLGQSAAALGLAFATLAVPLALSARWTSSTWALQGVALLWLGLRQQRTWPTVAGAGLQLLAGLAYVASFDSGSDTQAVFNGHTLNILLLALGAGGCALLLDRHAEQKSAGAGAVLWSLATFWWVWAGLRETFTNLPGDSLTYGAAWIGFVALSAVLARTLAQGLSWQRPTWWPALLMPTAALGVVAASLEIEAWIWMPQAGLVLALAAALAWVLPVLRDTPRRLATSHISGLAALCLAAGLAIHEGLSAINAERLGEGWRVILPWLPLALVLALLLRRPDVAGWPVADALPRYRRIAAGLAIGVLGTVWLVTSGMTGSAAPLPWVPVLNPLELFHVAGVLALAMALRAAPERSAWRGALAVSLGAASFLTLSMITLRASAHWLIPQEVSAYMGYSSGIMPWSMVWSTVQAQAALSVVWSLAGVWAWVSGSRQASRPLWTYGALLLGAVLLKLLLIDRQSLGDLLGILSFLTVGGLLVLVGRIAPRPPERALESQ